MSDCNQNNLGGYDKLLTAIKVAGYEFVEFRHLNKTENQIVLRHDVDFDTRMARECAEIESSLGIRSTYFFLLRSRFYNVYSLNDYDNILRIRDLGHAISIHFDPILYVDIHAGLRHEVGIFSELFGANVQIISLHRPQQLFLNCDDPIDGIEHTYQSKYFSKVKYFSDSQGVWRHGNPLESEEFRSNKSLHLLIHPIWWITHADSNYKKIELHFRNRVGQLKKDFAANCMPFREVYEQV